MSEVISFRVEDAIEYGEEQAIILYLIRMIIRFPREAVEINGIDHVQLTEGIFNAFLPYKPFKRIKTNLRGLYNLGVISIQNENYYGILK